MIETTGARAVFQTPFTGERTFRIVKDGTVFGIEHFACGLTSYHPDDVKHRYCGSCHVFLVPSVSPTAEDP